MKYSATIYFQTKKYKRKLTIKFNAYFILFIINFFQEIDKLSYIPSNLDSKIPKSIKKEKIITGTPKIFQQKQEILLKKNYPFNICLSLSFS